MTINRQTSAVSANGDGSNTSWAYNFLIPYKPDGSTAAVQVWLTDPTVFPITPILVPASQFSITGVGNASGGIVTYPLPSGDPIAAGIVITIQRAYPYVQETAIANQGNFFPQAVEEALDLLCEEIQQLQSELNRALLVPIGSGLDPDELMAFLIALFEAGGGGGGGGGTGSSVGLGYRLVTADTPSPGVVAGDHLGVVAIDCTLGNVTVPFLATTLAGMQVTFIRIDGTLNSAFLTNGSSTVATLTTIQTSKILKSTGLAIIPVPSPVNT